MRINKYFSNLGICSRREADRLILEKRVLLNDKVVNPGDRIEFPIENLTIDGKPIERSLPPKVYWVLNKPDKTLVSREGGPYHLQTIFDLDCLNSLPFLVHSVGRLDYRSEGLLILTNDGELTQKLCDPHHKVKRYYYALSDEKLSPEELKTINTHQLKVDDRVVRCKVSFLQRKNLGSSLGFWYSVEIAEGRNRIVRRIFETLGQKRVLKLFRYRFGPITLGNELKPGSYRQMSKQEIQAIKRAVNSSPSPRRGDGASSPHSSKLRTVTSNHG